MKEQRNSLTIHDRNDIFAEVFRYLLISDTRSLPEPLSSWILKVEGLKPRRHSVAPSDGQCKSRHCTKESNLLLISPQKSLSLPFQLVRVIPNFIDPKRRDHAST